MSNVDIANTILQQLGGRRFQVMTGAKHFIAVDKGLAFQLPSRFARNGINAIEITLAPSDTYRVRFRKFFTSRTRGMVVDTIAEYDDIYCDMLRSLFTRETGLDTHL